MMGTFYDAPNDYRNYICHYGVKGMKWGVRHDKPSSGKTHKRNMHLLAQTTGQVTPHVSKPKLSDNIEDYGYSINKEFSKNNDLFAEKKYQNGVIGWITAYNNTPNLPKVASNLDKISSDINRLRNEFAKVNYKNDSKDKNVEGYPLDYPEVNRKAFSNMKNDIHIGYHDTRNWGSEYKKGVPDDLYEMSMWSPVDDLEYVLPVSQNEYGHFYIDPKAKTEYR